MSVDRPQPADQDVRDTIATRLDRNACIEAGAGTGKTTVLVQRIVELLRTATVTVDDIAVITFTEKAAAELSVRVRQRLEEAALHAAAGSVELQRLTAALRGLHRARIETIHAFAGGLLRERPIEAGLDPQFEIVDALGATLDFDVAYDRWLVQLLEAQDPRVTRALNRTMQISHLRELAEAINAQRSVLPLAEIAVQQPDITGYLNVLDESVAELEAIRDAGDLPDDDPGVQQLPTVHAFIERVRSVRDDRLSLERVLARAPKFKGAGAQKNWEDPSLCRRQKGAVKSLSDANEQIRVALRTQALTEVMPIVAGFVEDFAEQRRRAGRLTFDDLLLWARDLVVDNEGVRDEFREQFKAILVDEFQDTDPVQAQLVLALAGDGPGRLVVVGDPKQSIYRFRRADIAIYDEIKHGALRDDLLQISQNFRSCDGIIEWANTLFNRVFTEQVGRQPGNVELGASGFRVPGDRSPVVVVHGAEADVEPDEEKRKPREQEARTLAATLALVHAEGWLIRDPETKEIRPARWRDIAVLVPWRTDLNLFEDAFLAAGVPLRHEGGKTFFRRQEVREFASCLHAIDDPGDRIALVATLRSPVFGCSDDDLLLWVTAGGSWTYLGGWDKVKDGPDTVREGLRRLRELHRARGGLSLPELVRRTLEETGAVEHVLTRQDGAGEAANLLKLVDQARDFSASGGGGLRAFTRWLARNSEEDSEETDAGISEETDDVVRLLTIHAAKGLEFPIVALANLSSRGKSTVPPIPNAAEHRLDLRVGTEAKTGWFSTPRYEEAKAAEKELIELERIRLLYVAVTRARDHLIVPVVGKHEQMLALIAPSLPAPGEVERAKALGVHILDRASLVLPPSSPAEIVGAEVDDDRVAAAVDEFERWRSANADLITTASFELPVMAATSLQKPWRPLVVSSESPDATLILGEGPPLPLGDAVHRVMELISLPDATDLDEIAAAICAEAELDDHVDEVIGLARRCLASNAVQRALAADQLVRELPFTIEMPDGPGYVNGRIDLLFREGATWTVVDYKTDAVDEALGLAGAAKKHEAQAGAYVEAVRRITGAEARVVFVFARSGGEATALGA
jgi:ATP-dependent exoDNAse (exonuclease V) beta subunit